MGLAALLRFSGGVGSQTLYCFVSLTLKRLGLTVP
jgi:hypothetical protein